MAQFMQPLARGRHQATAARLIQIGISGEPLTETFNPFRSAGRKQVPGALRQLLLQKTVKALLPPLKVGAAAIAFQGQGLLHRLKPGEQFAQLLTG